MEACIYNPSESLEHSWGWFEMGWITSFVAKEPLILKELVCQTTLTVSWCTESVTQLWEKNKSEIPSSRCLYIRPMMDSVCCKPQGKDLSGCAVLPHVY